MFYLCTVYSKDKAIFQREFTFSQMDEVARIAARHFFRCYYAEISKEERDERYMTLADDEIYCCFHNTVVCGERVTDWKSYKIDFEVIVEVAM